MEILEVKSTIKEITSIADQREERTSRIEASLKW
jgi:hypothetical protein